MKMIAKIGGFLKSLTFTSDVAKDEENDEEKKILIEEPT